MWAFCRESVRKCASFALRNSSDLRKQDALFFNNSEIDENENLITPRFISFEVEFGPSNAKYRNVISVFRKQFLGMVETMRVVLVHVEILACMYEKHF